MAPRRSRQTSEVAPNSHCPCESGKRYGNCCKKKQFKWVVDDRGNFSRRAPISDEAAEILRHARAQFEGTFGRSPRKADVVFVEKYYISDKEMTRQALRAMKAAGSRPELVYAYKKTGRLVTSKNKNMLTAAELKEWNNAFDEYYELIDSGLSPDDIVWDEGPVGFMQEALR